MSVHIHIPVTTSWASDVVVREVACERCGCRFRYRMVRRAQGRAVGNGGLATAAADARAKRHLAALLTSDHDPVSCPKCGWYQSEMERSEGRVLASKLRLMQSAACLMVLGGVLVLGALAAVATDYFNRPFTLGESSPMKAIAYTSISLGVLIFAIYFFQLHRQRLNNPYDPKILPRMPKAVEVSRENVMPAPMGLIDGGAADGRWCGVQLLDVRFPAMCVACLQPVHELHTLKPGDVALAKVTIDVPYCAACRRRARNGGVGLAMLIGTVIGVLFGVMSGDRTIVDWLAVCAVGFLVFGYLAWGFTDSYFRPIRFRRFSSLRNTCDIRFVNADFLPHFLNANGNNK